MALEWLTKKEPKTEIKPGEGEGDKFELKPAEVKAQLDKVSGLETSIAEVKGKFGVLDAMKEFLDEQKAAKEKKISDENKAKLTRTQEEIDEEWLTDPAMAARRQLQPLVESQVNTNAKLAMQEMFQSNPDEFEYASDPTIKRDVEASLARLPLASRADPESIRNCYYVATGRRAAEIKEGKIKARFSAISSSGDGKGGPKTGQEEDTVTLSDAEKKAARVFGLTEKEFQTSKKELNYV